MTIMIFASRARLAAIFGALIAPATALAFDLADTPISSDGYVAREAAISSTESAGSPGAGRVLRPGEVDDALANLRATKESAQEVWQLWEARPMTAPIGQESIIGADTRTRVNPTTTYPARATALITFSVPGGTARCTGWFISRDTIATAGHCVHPGGGGSFYPVSSYRIYPGRNGTASPYGSCTARRLSSVTGWTNSGLDNFDYAAIKLNCTIGSTVGWYGYFWTSASLLGLPTIINGYPGDKPLTQWRATGNVTVNQSTRVFYRNDTVGGMSGSAVYYNRSTSCRVCAMAVHAYGTYGSPPYSTNNHGTRITQTVFNNLTAWKNAP